MRRRSLLIVSTVTVVAAAVGGGMGLREALDGEPLPPLLRHVTAAGGWWGACPARTAYEAKLQAGMPLALSPELNKALEQQFPPGTKEVALTAVLRDQHFEVLDPCVSDPNVHQAYFKQKGGLTPATAAVFWKTNGADLIVWAKGFVAYDGP